MYINLQTDFSLSSRILGVNKQEVVAALGMADRALVNIMAQPQDSFQWESRVAAAMINKSFWQELDEMLSKQLSDQGNTVQLGEAK